jgi:hypothetical protein
MANICMARVRVEPKQTDSGNPRFPAEAVKSRLLALYYDHFELADEDPDKVEIECGFRWAPPFDELLALSAKHHVHIRCVYDEPGTGFMGAWSADDGTVQQDDCINY